MDETGTLIVEKQNKESYFDGSAFQLLGWRILGALITSITGGICFPFAICWLYDWKTKHTVINGKRLKFVGSAGELFGTWILCLLLTIVTLGIYSFYIPFKIKRWKEANIFFEDEVPSFSAIQNLKKAEASFFDGNFWELFGIELLAGIITFFTIGICYPKAMEIIYKYEQNHKVYNEQRCAFNGTASQLFGTWIICIILSLITFGIYTWWVPIKIKQWQINHTYFISEGPTEENQNKDSLSFDGMITKSPVIAFICGGLLIIPVFLISFLVNYLVSL